MSNPWDIPPLPTVADVDIDKTYCGVGCVISNWEGIEVNLSRIFSMFHAKTDDYETMQKYGGPTKFIHRFGQVRKFATEFFVKRHNQEIEGTLDELADQITGFSHRRNDLAHAIVNRFSFTRGS